MLRQDFNAKEVANLQDEAAGFLVQYGLSAGNFTAHLDSASVLRRAFFGCRPSTSRT